MFSLVYPFQKRTAKGCNPPLSLLMLATNLKRNGIPVSVIDYDGEKPDGMEDFAQRILKKNPAIIGMPLFSWKMKRVYEISKLIREMKRDVKILLGGPHATAMPETVLKEFDTVDYVLTGEADDTVVDLYNYLDSKTNIKMIDGLYYRFNENIVRNQPWEAKKDINDFPIPDRSIIDEYYKDGIYFRAEHPGITDIMVTSRGCPFNCYFCFQMKRGYRIRKIDNILAEIKYLRSRGVTSIHFEDDIFTINRKFCFELFSKIMNENLNIKFKVRSRVDTIDQELMNLLKKAGVETIVFGVESGSNKILKLMNKKNTVEQNKNAIRLAKKTGFNVYADFFIGYPGETPQTVEETTKFLLKERPHAVNISVFVPFPKTEVYDQCKKNKSLVGDWSLFNKEDPWVAINWIDGPMDLWEIVKKIRRKFYFHPLVFFYVFKNVLGSLRFKDIGYYFKYFLKSYKE